MTTPARVPLPQPAAAPTAVRRQSEHVQARQRRFCQAQPPRAHPAGARNTGARIPPLRSNILRSLSKIEFKEVQSYSRPIGRGVRTEWPPVIGVENTPGFEVSDRALDGRTQPIYLGIEFLLPVKQFPALRLLKRGDEARALITLVADPAESGRHDICGFCLRKGSHVVIMPGNGFGYE